MPSLRYFPVSYDVAGKRVIVAGNGAQALQRLRLLVRTQARLVLHAVEPSDDLAGFADEQGIEHIAADPNDAAIDGAALVFAASGNALADLWLARQAHAAGVPINVVDRPEVSDFALPAIVERAPVVVAISTDGHAPVLAQRIRAMIEALLPPGLGRVGTLAGALRTTVQARLPSLERRRHFWERFFVSPAAEAALAGDTDRARALAIEALDTAVAAAAPAKVSFVDAGPGEADLLTLRAHRVLQTADAIVVDRSVPEAVVAMGRRDAERVVVGRGIGRSTLAATEMAQVLLRLARPGRQVVRLVAGDPLAVAGAEISAVRRAGIAHEVVPGVGEAPPAAAAAA